MPSRRDAVESLAALAAAGLLPQSARAGLAMLRVPDSIERIGLQLYTVRSLMSKDMPGTLAAVAALGYREVEFAGYFGRTPSQVRGLLDANGLAAPSVHLGLEEARDWFDSVAEAAHVVGHRYLTVPSLDTRAIKTADDWRKTAEMFNALGQRAKAAGLRFAFHNHAGEFTRVDGAMPMDLLLVGTDPSLVTFELDLYWALKGGQDPRAYLDKHPGRFEMVHVKDATAAPAREMTDVGSGTMDWKRILAAHKTAGIRHYFVEHDNPADPMLSIRRSAEYLNTLRF